MNVRILKQSRVPNVIWILFGLSLVFYAFLAIQSGTHNFPTPYDQQRVQELKEVQALGDQGVPYSQVEEKAMDAYPLWTNIVARISGTYYGFGTNGNTETIMYYATMSSLKKYVLSTHMILGGACIVLGIFQFWPHFRRNYRKAHRAIGGAYIICAYTMVGASMYHLITTGVANTYQGFTFYVQLWFLVLSTLITQTLAIYHLKKRNFALHMGFQSYTFAAFLSAPLQRYDWMFFGWLYPHLSQGEVNNLVNIMGFWQCILVAYVVFIWNRSASPIKPKPVEIVPAPAGKLRILWTLAAIGIVTSIAQYLISPGLGSWYFARGIVPASTLAADAALFDGKLLQNILFTGLIVAAMFSGTWLMLRDEKSALARKVFYVSAFVAGVIQVYWGISLGEPSMKVISGGGFYLMSGISLIIFGMAAFYFEQKGREHMWHEMMVFAVNFAFTPALLLWMHAIWYYIDVIPQQYLNVGHGYILAAGGAILNPVFTGFFGSFTSRETMSRAVH